MRRQVSASPTEQAAACFGNPLAKPFDLTYKRVDLLLLANDDRIELTSKFSLKLALISSSVRRWSVGLHGCIGHWLTARLEPPWEPRLSTSPCPHIGEQRNPAATLDTDKGNVRAVLN